MEPASGGEPSNIDKARQGKVSGRKRINRTRSWNKGPGCPAKPSMLWRRGRESNPRIAVLQTATLPLGYPAICARNERNVGARRVNAATRSVPTNVIGDQ
jgi:hypothetical protein